MYYLPNKVAIDVDGLVDGMLEEDINVLYFFDIKTGDTIAIAQNKDVPTDRGRYFPVHRIPTKTREKWMKDFIKVMVHPEDKKLAGTLKGLLETKGIDAVSLYLDDYDESWLIAWDVWEGEGAFTRLEEWFQTLPVKVSFMMKQSGCCAICDVMRDGADEDELIDAFANEMDMNDASFFDLDMFKNEALVVEALRNIIKKYNLEDRLTVDYIRSLIFNSGKDPMQATKKFFEQWSSFFPDLFEMEIEETQTLLIVFNDAWNYFPHKSLDGKSPADLRKESM